MNNNYPSDLRNDLATSKPTQHQRNIFSAFISNYILLYEYIFNLNKSVF